MARGNGTDQGMIVAMLGEVLTQVSKLDGRISLIESRLGSIEVRLGAVEARLDRFGDESTKLRSDMDRGFAEVRLEIRGYHSAVVGHGIAITELEEQVGRLSERAGALAVFSVTGRPGLPPALGGYRR